MNNDFQDEGMVALSQALLDNTTLTTLKLGIRRTGKFVNISGAIAFAQVLTSSRTSLTTLVLNDFLDSHNASPIIKALGSNKSLVHLDLKLGNHESPLAEELVFHLQRHPKLTSLSLDSIPPPANLHCFFTDEQHPGFSSLW